MFIFGARDFSGWLEKDRRASKHREHTSAMAQTNQDMGDEKN
jgi:hypothetical protein